MSASPMDIRPVTLTGQFVELVPLSLEHLAQAIAIGAGTEIFRWFPNPIRTAEEMRAYFAEALQLQQAGLALPFSTMVLGARDERSAAEVLGARDERSASVHQAGGRLAGGQLVGGSRYLTIDRPNRHLEIGSTWIAPPWQRSAVNTEAKLLMLEHAFERLGCLRVEFKTDSLNVPSRTALARIGAKEEGTFRNHMVTASGRIRHSVYFSVIDSEWPQVKQDLRAKLARGARPR